VGEGIKGTPRRFRRPPKASPRSSADGPKYARRRQNANTEIVIEGEVAPGEMEDEGPFAVKRVTVVDVDVDICDPSHVDWALTTFPNF